MSINLDDAQKLHDAGFIDYEVEQISEAVDPTGKPQPPININDHAWTATLNSRREWRDERLRRGWTQEEINNAIMRWYRKDDSRSPFVFLKLEYPTSPSNKIDFDAGIKAREAAKSFGKQRYRGSSRSYRR